MKRILVTGSRDWVDAGLVRAEMLNAAGGDALVIIVVGDCPHGADLYARQFARHRGWFVELHNAHWHQYGHRAGPMRNAGMVKSGADIALAFIRGNSPGATGCARMAEDAGIPVRRFTEEPG